MDAYRYSLADFYASDSPSVVEPPADWGAWLAEPATQACMAFFEQPLLAAPRAATRIASRFDGKARDVINLTSYNYLGLATHPEVIGAARDAFETYGLGASGAAMLSGTYDLHVRLAEHLAAFKGREACALFSGGLMANYGALQGMLRRGDVLVMDEKCHQSIIDGGTLARARSVFFRHNDPDALAAVLEAHRGKRVLVAVEGVYSMDGDLGDLTRLAPVCTAYGVPLYVDEAHSSLLFGRTGRGIAELQGVEDQVAVTFGTLSKAFGGVGGFICSTSAIVRYIKSYASAYAFSCAPSPPVVAGCLKALEVATRDRHLQDRLWHNVARMRANLEAMQLNLGDSASQVIPIIIGESAELLFDMARRVQERGVFLQPVDYPAVPADQRRFRLSVTAMLTDAQIDEACNVIEDEIAQGVRR